MPKIKSFHLGENGTYMGSGFDYEYSSEEGRDGISIRIDGVQDEDALKLDADEAFVSSLEHIIEDHRIRKWDGFHGSDKNVLDGSSFTLSIRYDDGSSISAGGYMKYPKGYREALSAFDELFIPLYEAVRPDRRKVMTRYFEEVILQKHSRLERQEVCYPYVSDGGNMYLLGVCECSGGASMCPVYYDNEPEYMLVITLEKDGNSWELGCETYKITEKGEVIPWGSAIIDNSFFSSERLYGHIFTRRYKDQLQLGCFTQKGFSASGRDTLYYIDLYDIVNQLSPLANEKVQGPPNDREWWTPDKIADFIEVADKFGFSESKRYWEKTPCDPVFAGGMKDSANHCFDFILTNNHDSKFYNTLINTPKGERVGEYRVKGNLYPK